MARTTHKPLSAFQRDVLQHLAANGPHELEQLAARWWEGDETVAAAEGARR